MSLVNSTGVIHDQTPIDYWFDNVLKKREHSVWAQRDSFAAVHGFMGPVYQKGAFPSGNDALPVRTYVVYQYGKMKPEKQLLDDMLKRHLKSINGSDVQIRETKV